MAICADMLLRAKQMLRIILVNTRNYDHYVELYSVSAPPASVSMIKHPISSFTFVPENPCVGLVYIQIFGNIGIRRKIAVEPTYFSAFAHQNQQENAFHTNIMVVLATYNARQTIGNWHPANILLIQFLALLLYGCFYHIPICVPPVSFHIFCYLCRRVLFGSPQRCKAFE